jgi:hypothetical protein
MMLDHLESAINGRLFRNRCSIAIGELFSFVVGPDGKPKAMNGANDDTVLAGAIAWQLRQRKVQKAEALW